MMTVRTRVAKSESMPWIPILAKIAVSAAKQADRAAQKNHPPGVVNMIQFQLSTRFLAFWSVSSVPSRTILIALTLLPRAHWARAAASQSERLATGRARSVTGAGVGAVATGLGVPAALPNGP